MRMPLIRQSRDVHAVVRRVFSVFRSLKQEIELKEHCDHSGYSKTRTRKGLTSPSW